MSAQAWGFLGAGIYLLHAIIFGWVVLHYELKKAKTSFAREIAVPQAFVTGMVWPVMFPMWLVMESVGNEPSRS